MPSYCCEIPPCLVMYDNGSALLLYCQVLEQLICLLTVVRHLPVWSCLVMDLPCFTIVRSLSNWYAFLPLWDTSLSGLVWSWICPASLSSGPWATDMPSYRCETPPCLVLFGNGSALLHYRQVLEQLICLLTVVRHLPVRSCMIMDLPCFTFVRSLSNWYAFLL